MRTFIRFVTAVGSALACCVALHANAQSYPAKAIKVIVPWPAGGVVDVAGRIVGEKLQAELGQPVVVENRAGAGGMVGADAVARADADGYTLMLTSTALNLNVALGQKTSVDMTKAFAPIRIVAWAPSVLVTHPGLKLSSVKELVALAKSKPGQLNYASAGNGSPAHFAAEMFRSEAGLELVHVPYKGAPPAMTDQIAGHVSFHFANATIALPQVRAGKVAALAITAEKRSALFPGIPTMAEAGYPEVKANQWVGFFAPAATPRDIADRLAGAIGKVMANPDVRAALERQAMEVETESNPASFQTFLRADLARWQAVVKAANIKAD